MLRKLSEAKLYKVQQQVELNLKKKHKQLVQFPSRISIHAVWQVDAMILTQLTRSRGSFFLVGNALEGALHGSLGRLTQHFVCQENWSPNRLPRELRLWWDWKINVCRNGITNRILEITVVCQGVEHTASGSTPKRSHLETTTRCR